MDGVVVVDLLAGGGEGDDLVLAAAWTRRVVMAATEGELVGLAANLKLL